MNIKKIIFTLLTTITFFNTAQAEGFSELNMSELSFLSGGVSIILSPFILPLSVLDSLSSNVSNNKDKNYQNYAKYNNIKVTNVKTDNIDYKKTHIEAIATVNENQSNEVKQTINFNIPTAVVKDCNLTAGEQLNVKKIDAGYTLNSNNKVVGIIPNEKGQRLFQHQKVTN